MIQTEAQLDTQAGSGDTPLPRAPRSRSRAARSTSRTRRRASRSASVRPRLPSIAREDAPEAERGRAKEKEKRIQVMVVGLGMVGIAFIEKLLALDTEGRYFVRTCGEEPTVAYNRVGLTEYFQHRNVEDLYLAPMSWYAAQSPAHFAFHVGEAVTSIDTAGKTVCTSRGNTFAYDVLVLATGSVASLPSYVRPGEEKAKGVFVYRSLADLDAIGAYAKNARSATVVGGGLLGLEAAKAVHDLGLAVSIQMRGAYPLSRQLDAAAGELVLRRIEGMGVAVLPECCLAGLAIDAAGTFTGFRMPPASAGEGEGEGEVQPADMVVFAVGIRPRDDLAAAAGLAVHARGGVVVGDDLATSVPGVFAVGECASWRGHSYGLIAPGIEMADILAFNLTQTARHAPRAMNAPDLSTRLKLMGVDVASFGDYFADERAGPGAPPSPLAPDATPRGTAAAAPGEVAIQVRKPSRQLRADGPVRCLTYHDPFSGTYKKYVFSGDGARLLGGMMVGDVADFARLVSITKKAKRLDQPPGDFILGRREDDGGAGLEPDAVVCACHGVTKAAITKCAADGCADFAGVKKATKAGTGCGGCVPLATSIFAAELEKAGGTLSTDICAHIRMPRRELVALVRVKQLRDFAAVMAALGGSGQGCEVCKPCVASVLASTWAAHVLAPALHGAQDTNDRSLANIQRDGTYSVIPRVPGGEIRPSQLMAIGQIAEDFKLYAKITGGQRIDLLGAHRADLPRIWERLHAAGMESGHAYGKALRTVKSCVGSNWCRFGVGDAVGLAIELENRYKGIRAPHKIKGGVSGCVRECAEARGKDFGLIATDKGWNIFIGGNGGVTPRHAVLFAADVPPSKVVRILDRFMMFYIQTAERLQRTAGWVASFAGGVERLRGILLRDELGVCAQLEADMAALVGAYVDEWAAALADPGTRARFRQFANTDARAPGVEMTSERGQARPAAWPKDFTDGKKFAPEQLATPREEWAWVALAHRDDLQPNDRGTTSCAVKYGSAQLAIFNVPGRGYRATQQMCPHKRAFVLEHGIVGENAAGELYVSCPLHKRNFALDGGACTNDEQYGVLAFDVKEDARGNVLVRLPPKAELEGLLGTERWMVRRKDGSDSGVEVPQEEEAGCGGACGGDSKLEW